MSRTTQTRAEHLAWCKQRAMQEYDFYVKSEGHSRAALNAVTSMESDMTKHPETGSGIGGLAFMMVRTLHTRADVQRFIDGYN